LDRHLLEMCTRAAASGDAHVLVIDELNRTDPSRVFGEAMTYMEVSLRGQSFYLPSGRQTAIPKNLYFLATMNPEDRSVDDIDAAMDRRWAKIQLPPDRNVLLKFLKGNGLDGAALGAVLAFFTEVQKHYRLGHAFFRSVSGPLSFRRLCDHQLLPLFEKNFRFAPDTLNDLRSLATDAQMKLSAVSNSGTEQDRTSTGQLVEQNVASGSTGEQKP
jgi:5-methylcytosine-specific restriction protein B